MKRMRASRPGRRAAEQEAGEQQPPEGPLELAIVGDLTDNGPDLCAKLLEVPPAGECVLYFDSLGGSPYSALSLASLIKLRGLRATGVVAGECSSAALWPLAACRRRLVTRLSVLLFHPMKWQSEENVALSEAAEWARHFAQLEGDMDRLLAELFAEHPATVAHANSDRPAGEADGSTDAARADSKAMEECVLRWTNAGRYVAGPELAEAGMAELIELQPMEWLCSKEQSR